jgi:hypothetical protein
MDKAIMRAWINGHKEILDLLLETYWKLKKNNEFILNNE